MAPKALGDCDVSSPEFRSKVEDLAGKLAVPLHPDPSVTFEACCTLIRERAAKSDVGLPGFCRFCELSLHLACLRVVF